MLLLAAAGALLVALAAPAWHAADLDGCHNPDQCQLCQILVGGAVLGAVVLALRIRLEQATTVPVVIPLALRPSTLATPFVRGPPSRWS